MKQYLLFVFALGWGLSFFACKQGPSGAARYYAKGRWRVADPNSYRPLKGQPIEVGDSVFGEREEGRMDSTGKFLESEKWIFNKQGALRYRRLFFTDSFWNETIIRRNDSGERHFIVMHSGADKKSDTAMIFKLEVQADGRFKETAIDPQGHTSRISFISFPSGGDVLKEEFQEDTASGAKISTTDLNVYDGDRLLQLVEQHISGDSARAEYFYSTRGFLDSIINRMNGKISRRDIFKNNESGDPIRLLTLSPMGDTVEDHTCRYEYDRQGNWSKRWERQVSSNSQYGEFLFKGDHYPVTLTIRRIVYPGGDAVAVDD